MRKLLCLLLSLLLAGCAGTPVQTEPAALSGKLTLHCLEGAVLVQCNGENLLVDCGITPQTLREYEVESLSAIVLTDREERREQLDALLEAWPAQVWSHDELPEEEQWLDCARVTVLRDEKEDGPLAVKLCFGEDTAVLTGAGFPAEQEGLQADVLCLYGEAPGALVEAVNPAYLLVDGSARREAYGAVEVFDTASFGPLTMETEGSGIAISWSLFHSTPVATG